MVKKIFTGRPLVILCLGLFLLIMLFGLNIFDTRVRLTAMALNLATSNMACLDAAGNRGYVVANNNIIYIDSNNRQVTCFDRTSNYEIKLISAEDSSVSNLDLDSVTKKAAYDAVWSAISKSPFSCAATSSAVVQGLIDSCNNK